MYDLNKHGRYLTFLQGRRYENLFIDKYQTFETIKKKKTVILENSCACHNFAPFIAADGSMMAIGGQDAWRHDHEWYNMTTGEEFIEYYQSRFGKKYQRNPVSALKQVGLFKKLNRPLDHTRGLYIFDLTSSGWKPVLKSPIITVKHPGFNSALGWKSADFDGHIWIIWRKDRYFLFVRNNVEKGKRFVQYSTSKDLFSWEPFRPVNIKPKTENIYFMVGGFYDGRYIAMLPAYDRKRCFISCYESKDLINFKFIKDIFKNTPIFFGGEPRNRDHPVSGFNNGKFFIHHNYMSIQRPSNIGAYNLNEIF